MYAVRWDRFSYSPLQFGIWRIAFGIYLFYYFLAILPWGAELYSSAGPYADTSLYSSTYTFIPTVLFRSATPAFVYGLHTLGALLSLCLIAGFARRTASFGIWMIFVWLWQRNYTVESPEWGFVNWLLAAMVFIPIGERLSLAKINPTWKMPKSFYWGAWIVLAFGYFYAGSSKFSQKDPAWMDGSAMLLVLSRDNARFAWFGNFFEHIPMSIYKVVTWSALALQTFAGVFIYFRKIRPWWWLAATGIHVTLLFLANLAQLTWGMIFFHMFLFDMNWWYWVRAKYEGRATV